MTHPLILFNDNYSDQYKGAREFPEIQMIIMFGRNSSGHALVLNIPAILMFFLAVFMFLTPNLTSDRVGHLFTLLIAMTVFVTYVQSFIPVNKSNEAEIPWIVKKTTEAFCIITGIILAHYIFWMYSGKNTSARENGEGQPAMWNSIRKIITWQPFKNRFLSRINPFYWFAFDLNTSKWIHFDLIDKVRDDRYETPKDKKYELTSMNPAFKSDEEKKHARKKRAADQERLAYRIFNRLGLVACLIYVIVSAARYYGFEHSLEGQTLAHLKHYGILDETDKFVKN